MNLPATYVRIPPLLAILLIGAAGCGLSDYQNRMDAQRERVKEFDDANRALDDPIETPSMPASAKAKDPKDPSNEVKEANPAWLFDFYLRLPKGYGKTPSEKAPYFAPFPCFRYTSSEAGFDILVAAALVAKTKDEVRFGQYFKEDFRYFVRMAVKDFYARMTNKLELKLPEKDRFQVVEKKMLSPYSDVTANIPYYYIVYSDAKKEPTVFRVYIHETSAREKEGSKEKEPGRQVAIIVHPPQGTANEALDKAIDACLGTLDVSSEAGNKRTQYKKLMKR